LETKLVQSPKGRSVNLTYREDTSDLATIGSTWRLWGKLEDEYDLASLPDDLTGTAIDIGAHIGSVALALLVDHPRLKVVAVEPLAENIEIIELNATALGVTDRLTIKQAGISSAARTSIDWNWRSSENENYWRTNRYIGNVVGAGAEHMLHDTAVVPGISLSSLVAKRTKVPFLKIDCEGCEWVALTDPLVARIDLIAGEYHGHPGPEGVMDLLGDTHDVNTTPNGACGLFRAVKR
jgi:FkbM family methyltransferase